MAVFQLHKEQKLPASIDEVWAFISSPKNLSRITPKNMGFEITTQYLKEEMYAGQMITYKVKPLAGIKTTWVTEITHIKDKSYFVDEQRVGPYSLWHHQHIIEAAPEGVLMKDIVSYKPPFGFLGSIANALVIKNKLNEIFEYRTKVLETLFPK